MPEKLSDRAKWVLSMVGAAAVSIAISMHRYDGAAAIFVFLHLYLRGD